MARTAFEEAVVSGVNLHAGAKFSDGTFPHNFWVSANAGTTADGAGNGSQYAPYLTVRRAIRQSIDGRGDRIIVGPGSYAESLDIGSGSTNGGNTNGGYAKRDLQLLGDDSLYNGRVQIIGDGATAAPTVRVNGSYLRGFVLKNMELDTNGLTQACLHLETNDTGAGPGAGDDDYRFLVENVAVRSDDPDVGILFVGATLGTVRKCWMQGPDIGLGFVGSANNNCSDIDFEDIDFRDNIVADIATVANAGSPVGRILPTGRNLTNMAFHRMRHWDRGGTPVTNYVNFPSGTMVNVHGFDCYWARDVADDTLLALPANVVFLGHSAGGVETIVGA